MVTALSERYSFDTLQQAHAINSGQVNINLQTLDGYWSDYLRRYYFDLGEIIQIDGASITVDEAAQQLQISGKSNYLLMPNLNTTVTIWLDEQGAPQLQVHYSLFTDYNVVQKWRFSDSFPGLPLKTKRLLVGKYKHMVCPMLDDLDLNEAAFVVSSAARETSSFDCPLSEGVNFVGKLRPLGFLGILQNLLPVDIEPVSIFGAITILADDTRLDMSGLNTDVSKTRLYPWEVDDAPVPGIHLAVKLPLDFPLGKAALEETYVHFYTPINQYDESNNHFWAMSAVTANLNIQSAGLTIDMVCDLNGDMTVLNFEGRFNGFSLENLAKLADIGGDKGFDVDLPEVFNQALKPLKRLELQSLGFQISWLNNQLSFDEINLGIGISELNWEIWPEHISVTDIGSQFIFHQPFNKDRDTEIRLWGKSVIEGAQVEIQAIKRLEQLQFMTVISDATLPLKKLMKSFAPSLPAPGNLTINQLKLVASPGRFCQFIGSLAEQPNSWDLNLGPVKLQISNVQFDLLIEKQTSGYQSSGSFSGQLNIGKNIQITTSYTLPGEFMIRGSANQLRFSQLLSKLTNQPISLPKGMDFTLTNASVMIQKGSNGLTFQLASNVEGFGYLAFEVKKTNGKWGAAAGFSLDSELTISDIPGLSGLKVIEKVVLMQDFTLVLSSYDGPQFRFPDMAAFNNPALPAANVQLPATSGGLIAGINCYGKWQLDSSGKQGKLLRSILGLDPTLAITLAVSNPPNKQSSVFASIDTTINGKWPLTGQLGVAINQNTPEFFAAATADVIIARRKCRFDLALSIVTSGVYFTGSMLGSIKVGGLQLSNMALMTGMNYAGIPSLGVAATIDIKDISSSIALFFDANDPSKSVFCGAISDINLADIASVFANVKKLPAGIGDVLENIGLSGTGEFLLPNNIATALDNLETEALIEAFKEHGGITLSGVNQDLLLVVKQKAKHWALTDLQDMMKHYSLSKTDEGIKVTLDAQVYNVPQSTRIGSLVFNQGLLLNGKLRIMDQTAICRVEISRNKGLMIAAELEKALIIYKKRFFCLKAVADEVSTGKEQNVSKGASVSIATMRQPKHQEPLFRNPHIYLNGQLDMMGLQGMCYVSITSKGCFFKLSLSVKQSLKLPGISGKVAQTTAIDGNFGKISEISASVLSANDYAIKIDFGELGKLKLNTKVSGEVAIAFDGRTASAVFKGQFSVQKKNYNITLKLEVDSIDLANLAQFIAKELKKTFSDVFKDAEKWAGYAKNGLMEGVEGVENVSKMLQKHFKHDAKAAAKVLRSIGHSIDTIGNTLKSVYKLDADDMKGALKSAGYAASSVDKFVGSSFKSATKAVSKTASSTAKKAKKKTKKKAKKAKKKTKKLFK